MNKKFEVRWEGELPASPAPVWDALTAHSEGYLWRIEYEPRDGSTAKVRQALGLPDNPTVGAKVTMTPEGMIPIDGVIEYTTDAFTGVRSADALYRIYGRDAWGWPVGVAHHFFDDRLDKNALQQTWNTWLKKAVA